MTEEQRKAIVGYRIENAVSTLGEVKNHRDNGYYNTAVNRLYYACYYAASALLVANGIESKRSSGDYEDFINHTEATVNELYPLAEEFVNTIRAILSE